MAWLNTKIVYPRTVTLLLRRTLRFFPSYGLSSLYVKKYSKTGQQPFYVNFAARKGGFSDIQCLCVAFTECCMLCAPVANTGEIFDDGEATYEVLHRQSTNIAMNNTSDGSSSFTLRQVFHIHVHAVLLRKSKKK